MYDMINKFMKVILVPIVFLAFGSGPGISQSNGDDMVSVPRESYKSLIDELTLIEEQRDLALEQVAELENTIAQLRIYVRRVGELEAELAKREADRVVTSDPVSCEGNRSSTCVIDEEALTTFLQSRQIIGENETLTTERIEELFISLINDLNDSRTQYQIADDNFNELLNELDRVRQNNANQRNTLLLLEQTINDLRRANTEVSRERDDAETTLESQKNELDSLRQQVVQLRDEVAQLQSPSMSNVMPDDMFEANTEQCALPGEPTAIFIPAGQYNGDGTLLEQRFRAFGIRSVDLDRSFCIEINEVGTASVCRDNRRSHK